MFHQIISAQKNFHDVNDTWYATALQDVNQKVSQIPENQAELVKESRSVMSRYNAIKKQYDDAVAEVIACDQKWNPSSVFEFEG